MRISDDEFDAAVAEALDGVPERFKAVLHNIAITVADEPTDRERGTMADPRGELLGLAFDGNWEAMSGDVAFEPALQRTISVDIRYVLFIIDKYAGAGYLLDEMTLMHDGQPVKPKK